MKISKLIMRIRMFLLALTVVTVPVIGFAAVRADAWNAEGNNATSVCTPSTQVDQLVGKIEISYRMTNPKAKWNVAPWKLYVDSVSRGKIVVKTLPPGATNVVVATETVPGDSTLTYANEITHHWEDGLGNTRHLKNKLTVTSSIKLKGDCTTAAHEASVSMTMPRPTCDATSLPVTITTGPGNVSSQVALLLVGQTKPLYSARLMPNVKQTVNVKIGAGNTYQFKLLSNGKVVQTSSVVSVPAQATCHPTSKKPPTKEIGQPITDNCVNTSADVPNKCGGSELAFTGSGSDVLIVGGFALLAFGLAFGLNELRLRRTKPLFHGGISL